MILIHGCDRPSTRPLPVGDIGPNPHLNSRTISVDCQEKYVLDTVVIQKLNFCSDCDGSGYTKTGDYSDHLIPKAVDPKPVPYGVVLKDVHSNRFLTSHDKQE
jgi:hypothetical protein